LSQARFARSFNQDDFSTSAPSELHQFSIRPSQFFQDGEMVRTVNSDEVAGSIGGTASVVKPLPRCHRGVIERERGKVTPGRPSGQDDRSRNAE
jgi:hypothetical protein